MSHYKSNLRDIEFNLFEVLGRGEIEVGCDFCGAKYTFDSIDASALFVPAADHPSGSGTMQ